MKISGVSLIQKVQGGTYRVKFRDPKTDAKHQRKVSTGTKDYEIALRIAQELSLLIRSRAYWNSPPEGLHPRVI